MHPHEYAKLKSTSGAQTADPRAFGLLKAAYSVNEALEVLSIGRTSLYAAVKRGDLKPVKFGKSSTQTTSRRF